MAQGLQVSGVQRVGGLNPKPHTLDFRVKGRVSLGLRTLGLISPGIRSNAKSIKGTFKGPKMEFRVWGDYRGYRVYGLGFSKIRGTILGTPVLRNIICWNIYWGPLYMETTR